MDIYIYLFTFLLTLIGFIYGCIKFLKKGTAMYLWMITLGVGCAMLTSLLNFLQILTQGVLPLRFNVGMFGSIGTFLCFFTANFGQMDSLVDDGSKKFIKYRIIAVLAPILLLVLYMPTLVYDIEIGLRIVQTVILIVTMLASYFHLKHFIFPDVDFGIIKCIRGYNFLALLYSVCSILSIVGRTLSVDILWMTAEIIGSIILLCILPILGHEVKKWKI